VEREPAGLRRNDLLPALKGEACFKGKVKRVLGRKVNSSVGSLAPLDLEDDHPYS
jgi:hypothetical protein